MNFGSSIFFIISSTSFCAITGKLYNELVGKVVFCNQYGYITKAKSILKCNNATDSKLIELVDLVDDSSSILAITSKPK